MTFKSLINVFSLTIAHSVVCPPRNSLIEHGRDLVQNVSIYDDIKPMSATSFAQQQGLTEAQVTVRYAATGVFVCDQAAGNGQIVAKGNTVVTVFHTLLKDRRSCDQPRKIKGCAFIFQDGAKTMTINAKRVVSRGGCKPGGIIESGDDWAIIELEKSLPKSILPYKVPAGPELQAGKAVTMVGRTRAFNPDPKNKDFFKNPQSFSSCVAIAKDTFSYFNDYQSNCPPRMVVQARPS